MVIMHCNSSSPPIPTNSMPDRAFPNRRQKRGNQDVDIPSEGPVAPDIGNGDVPINNDPSRVLRKSSTSSAAYSRNIKSTRFRGLRPRASTLPSLVSTAEDAVDDGMSMSRDNYSDSFPLEDPSPNSTRDDFDDDFDDGELDEENIADHYEDSDEQPFSENASYDIDIDETDSDDEENIEYQEQPDLRSQFFQRHRVDNAVTILEDSVPSGDNNIYTIMSEHAELEIEKNAEDLPPESMLAELSEDESDLEDELTFAVSQIHHKPHIPFVDKLSPLSSSQLPSATTSPEMSKRNGSSASHVSRFVQRQRSLEADPPSKNSHAYQTLPAPSQYQSERATKGELNNNNLESEVTLNNVTRERTSTMASSKQQLAPLKRPPTNGYGDQSIAGQQKLEIGLGLRDSSDPAVTHFFIEPLRKDRSSLIPLNIVKKNVIIIPERESRSSFLTKQIKVKQAGFDNPLEEYISASGKAERKPLRVKMYMPSCENPKRPWEVVVRTDVNVSNAIGFALYCYMEEKRTPPLSEDMCNANKWTLRIVEDDGEPDEDFPALDRTRMLSAYSFDEFALVEATPEQVIKHEKDTPATRKPKAVKPAVKDEPVDNKPQAVPEENTPERVTLRVYQYPFDEMSSALYWTEEINVKRTIDEISYHICIEKDLDYKQYVLKIAGRRSIIPEGATVMSLNGQYSLEITPRRIVNKINGYDELLMPIVKKVSSDTDILPASKIKVSSTLPISSGHRASLSLKRASASLSASFNFRTSTEEGSRSNANTPRVSFASNRPTAGPVATSHTFTAAHHRSASNVRGSLMVPPLLPESLNSIGFQKYMIWRRQPMSFINRHERVLALDGEYVHIMPSDDRVWYDYSPKTSSFHISQMKNCKQSRKIPTNFKVVIMKTTGVTKQYDLEAITAQQAQEIVSKLIQLLNSYRMNNDSSRKH